MDIQMKPIGHGERAGAGTEICAGGDEQVQLLGVTSKTYVRDPATNQLKATRVSFRRQLTLKKIMIRHTKAQRIDGEAALALPDADCATVLLDMSVDERISTNTRAAARAFRCALAPTASMVAPPRSTAAISIGSTQSRSRSARTSTRRRLRSPRW